MGVQMTYNDLIQLTIGMNDIVVQEVSAQSALEIAEFAEALQENVDSFEDKRIALVVVADEDERDRQFHELLQEEVTLPNIQFSKFKDVKLKPTMVLLFKRLNLW